MQVKVWITVVLPSANTNWPKKVRSDSKILPKTAWKFLEKQKCKIMKSKAKV